MELHSARKAWTTLLGKSQVIESGTAQLIYGRCTTGVSRKLLGALKPLDRSQISSIVKIAAQYKVPIYPISTGHNWGYGSALPPIDNCFILDLSALNRIVDFEENTGLLTIEPGVTQKQLSDFLKSRNYAYMVPVTGAGPSCSILGNALERGYGITPYSDHFDAVMSLEVVLADGRIYRSALSSLNGQILDRSFKWGVGPYLDGIFSQSSFGVVTEMTLVLARRPEVVKSFIFGLENPDRLAELVELVRGIIARYPGIVGGINLMNAHRVLAMTVPYPQNQVAANKVISSKLLSELCKKNNVMPWNGFGTLYGTTRVVKAAQLEIKIMLKPLVSRLVFLNSKDVEKLNFISRILPGRFRSSFSKKLRVLEHSLQLVSGYPNETALPLCYWRSNTAPQSDQLNMNPARDKCGLIWYAPLIPMKPDCVTHYVQMVTDIMLQYKLEPLITLTSLSCRCFDSTVPLLFDLHSIEKRRNAEDCYWALLNEGQKHGYLPYRVGIQSMNWLSMNNSIYWQVVRKFKNAIDPDSIISPGRYV